LGPAATDHRCPTEPNGLRDGPAEKEHRRDQGTPFASLHHELGHITAVNRMLLDRLVTGKPVPFDSSAIVHGN
jgi:uncharacterized damage-inducible protein DinB